MAFQGRYLDIIAGQLLAEGCGGTQTIKIHAVQGVVAGFKAVSG